ncbi:MAG: HpcH/HpaI aldolase/citrate lyase family protein [Solirubrobacteraceae bacterium]
MTGAAVAVCGRVAAARTLLFVPGDRPDRFEKAAAAGAGAVVLDLEDAVMADRKAASRTHVCDWLDSGWPAMVRVNPAASHWFAEDLDLVAGRDCVVMLPKAESASQVTAVSRCLGQAGGVVPLVETPVGVARAPEICAAVGVVRPAFWHLDLAVALRVDPDNRDALLYARSALVLAAAAAEVAAPFDGVTTAIGDRALLEADIAHGLGLGMTGKLCIHPSQVPIAHAALAPMPRDVSWARQVIEAAADSEVRAVDGRMVDPPVLSRARAILARAMSDDDGSLPPGERRKG